MSILSNVYCASFHHFELLVSLCLKFAFLITFQFNHVTGNENSNDCQSTLVLRSIFPKHIFRSGGCCNPPHDYQLKNKNKKNKNKSNDKQTDRQTADRQENKQTNKLIKRNACCSITIILECQFEIFSLPPQNQK